MQPILTIVNFPAQYSPNFFSMLIMPDTIGFFFVLFAAVFRRPICPFGQFSSSGELSLLLLPNINFSHYFLHMSKKSITFAAAKVKTNICTNK